MLFYYIKKSFKNTLLYGMSAFFARCISFLFLPFFLSRLSLHELGIWDFYQTWCGLGTLAISSCATISMIRFMLLYRNDVLMQKRAIGNAFGLVLIGIAILVCSWLGLIYFSSWHVLTSFYGAATFLNLTLIAFFSMIIAYLRTIEAFRLYLLAFFSQSLIAVFLTVLGVQQGYGIESFFYANAISLIPFSIWFLILFVRNLSFSWSLLKAQLNYSIPLLAAGLLYTLFFSIDRFFLKHYGGFEVVGCYSLLWRFGAIFQVLSVAIADAWPIVFFNAQKEENGTIMIARLSIYFCLALMTGCLVAILGARLAIGFFLAAKYHALIDYLPLFFLPLLTVSLAQLFGATFGLAQKTMFTPFIISGALVIQVILLVLCASYGIWGVCIGNAVAFMLYCAANYYAGSYVYGQSMTQSSVIIRLMFLFFLYIVSLQVLFSWRAPWYLACMLVGTWPGAVLLLGFLKKEWETCLSYIRSENFRWRHLMMQRDEA